VKTKELAKLVSGKISGNGNTDIKGVAPLDEAKNGDLVFVLDKKFLSSARDSAASALVVAAGSDTKEKPAIIVDNPRKAMAKILLAFAPKRSAPQGIHATAVVPASCKIGANVSVGPFVALGENVSVGEGTVIYPHVFIGDNGRVGRGCVIHSNVSIYERVTIGDRVILHSGVRLGVDGYGYVQEAGRHIKIPQIGAVLIEDDVEIYSNVTVARATLGRTIIGAGTKIDCISHIAHNCKIGKNCAIITMAGISGSVTLKDHVTVAGQVGFSGHNTVGENAVIMARTGVTKDIPANAVVSGFPPQDHRKEMEFQATLRRLAKKNR